MTTNKLAVSVKEAAALVSLPASTIWLEIASERLRSFKVGRRRLVKVSELAAWVERRAVLSGAPMRLPVGPRTAAPAARSGGR